MDALVDTGYIYALMKIRDRLISLLRDFSNGKLPAIDFVREYVALRRESLDEHNLDPSLRQAERDVIQRRISGEISPEDFETQFKDIVIKLWQDRDIKPFTREAEILEQEVLSAVERFHAPSNPNLPEGYSIDEEQLREIVSDLLNELLRS